MEVVCLKYSNTKVKSVLTFNIASLNIVYKYCFSTYLHTVRNANANSKSPHLHFSFTSDIFALPDGGHL